MRMIRVFNNYGGRRTHEQRIPAGDYSEDDPRLFGLADYLIESGHAAEVLYPASNDTAELEPVPSEEVQAVNEVIAEESERGVIVSKRRRHG